MGLFQLGKGKTCRFLIENAGGRRVLRGAVRLFVLWYVLSMVVVLPVYGQGAAPTGIDTPTGVQSDLAIDGPGYFIVCDPVSGRVGVTRWGEFTVDANAYLVNALGWRVQGYSDPDRSQIGDLQLDNDASTTAALQNYVIQGDGKIRELLADGTQFIGGQILLQNFTNPACLKAYPYGQLGITPVAGALARPMAPGTDGLGTILAGELEIPIPKLTLTRIQPSSPGLVQGALTGTGLLTDLGIEGRGLFEVRDTNSNTLYATRAGVCYLDGNGHLVNYAGLRVQGYVDAGLTATGDIQISATGIDPYDPDAVTQAFAIDSTGTISAFLDDGTSLTTGQILLTDCARPEFLVRTNFGLYAMSPAAGPWTTLTTAASGDLGWIIDGALELSQCDESILAVRQKLNFFTQGVIEISTNPADLAINGTGFFTVRDPAQNIFYATRHGAFHLDADAYLVDTNGFRVQGFTDADQIVTGDLRIDTNGAPVSTRPNATVLAFDFDSMGFIHVLLSDGTIFVRGQVQLQNYRDLQALVPAPNLLYSNVAAALPLFPATTPLSHGLGGLIDGALETPYVQPPLQLPLQHGLRLHVTGVFTPITLQTSRDLLHWSDCSQLTGSIMNDAELFDTNSSPQKFYRVRLNDF